MRCIELVSRLSFIAPGFLVLAAANACAELEKLRGDYTLGHEVNSFCPQTGGECFWLGPGSSQAARERLKQIYEQKKPGLYKPVCVVVEAVIDRDSPRQGFASDYDGLIDIVDVQGACDGDS